MFSYDFMQNAFFVAICISLLCPCIGIFMVLRRSSMIGDTMSHASLAGITLGLLTNTNPILGAFIFTAICGALIEFHYPNFQNDMWRVYGLVFFDDKEHFRKGEEK
ncbi:ABC-3 protein, partial [human gut metagenome]